MYREFPNKKERKSPKKSKKFVRQPQKIKYAHQEVADIIPNNLYKRIISEELKDKDSNE